MERFYLNNTARYETLVKKFQDGIPVDKRAGVASANISLPSTLTICARTRPLSDEDAALGFPCALYPRPIQEGRPSLVDVHDLYNHPRGRPVLKSCTYHMDRLFDTTASSEDIYDVAGRDLVTFALSGGVGTLFAYGQTGSGKTYTISQLERLVAASIIGTDSSAREINMTVVDLAGSVASDLLNSRKPISILEDASGTIQLAGAVEHHITDREDMLSTFEQAASLRRTASTSKNDASSRSHSICRIRIADPTSSERDGFLYLIDLAGSEAARDVAQHGADRMRETRDINMSLSVLKDCLRCKAELDSCVALGTEKPKNVRVPYRQSALTKVLKHVFDIDAGRSCRTLIIACVSPSLIDVAASKNTLRYAQMLHMSNLSKKSKEELDRFLRLTTLA